MRYLSNSRRNKVAIPSFHPFLHNFNCKRKLGSPMHQQKSWQILTLFNSKRAGQVTPLRLKKKSSSPSPHSSRQTPFSKHFLKKYPHVIEEHNIIHKKIVK